MRVGDYVEVKPGFTFEGQAGMICEVKETVVSGLVYLVEFANGMKARFSGNQLALLKARG